MSQNVENGVRTTNGSTAEQYRDGTNTELKDQEGLFVWAKVPEEIQNAEQWLDDILYKSKVFITPGFIFGEQGRQYIRISLCATEDKLRESLHRIKINQDQ